MPNVLSGVVPASTTQAMVDQATYTISALAPLIELTIGLFLGFLVIQIIFAALGNTAAGEIPEAYPEDGAIL